MQDLKTKEFIEKAIKKHGDKYDYSKVEYINNHTKVCIICPEHGEFWQVPGSHLSGRGCPKCARILINNSLKISSQTFIENAHKVHGNKYDYSKVEYKNTRTKVCIICPKHGEFWQTPNGHVSAKSGCQKCYDEIRAKKQRHTTEHFIEKAKCVHGNKYDYSLVNYINTDTKVEIICSKHGVFKQTPYHHLAGHGCPICQESLLENEVKILLDNNNISYERQKKFPEWLGRQTLDFYLPDYNIAIECQGLQHFKPVTVFGGVKGFSKQQERDNRKVQLCKENDIRILYFTHEKIVDDKGQYITTSSDLISEIKKRE